MAQRRSVTILNKKRLVIAFIIFAAVMVLLCFRVGYIQIVKGDDYKRMAEAQQTEDAVIQAKRGCIDDRNGTHLAESIIKYSIWVRPSSIETAKTKEANNEKMQKVADKLSGVLDVSSKDIMDAVSGKSSVVKIVKYASASQADKVRKMNLAGIEITEQTKRYYPQGNFASQLLGSVTDDNEGLAGLELEYNSYLKGIDGRWVYNKDVLGNLVTSGTQRYESAQDGYTVETTIDAVIQQYAETACKKIRKSSNARRVSCLVMDPKTGEILACSSYPGYDPNEPRTPVGSAAKAKYKSLSDTQKLKYLQKMWRCTPIQDIYEPGSTFKLLTASMALEENKTNMSEHFYDSGSINVEGTTLKCWSWREPHGDQDLEEAVGNSCNPVFATLAMRIGASTFYNYMGLFGVTEKTGVDFPGEGQGVVMTKAQLKDSKVNLATQGYGQGISVTPIQLLTAISAIGNDGMMMQPHLVKSIKDSKGKTVKTYDSVKVRQVISEDTAGKMKKIMQFVVDKGGGEKAKIKGVKVGGKTGTAQVVVNGKYSDDVVASFVGMAPMDDPKIAVLFLVDRPSDQSHGGVVAAPGARYVIKNSLQYMNLADDK